MAVDVTNNGHHGARSRRPPASRRLPHDIDMEQSLLGGILVRNQILDELHDLEIDSFYDLRHRVIFEAMRNLRAAERPIDIVVLEHEIEKVGKLEAIGGIAYLGELCLRVPTVDNAFEYAATVVRLHRNRGAMIELSSALERAYGWPHDPSELVSETIGQLERFRAVDLERNPTAARRPWRCATELAVEVARAAGEPWAGLHLGPDELVRVRSGGMVVVMGGPGSGKSSLVSCLLLEHAKAFGPAIAVSIELPGDELAARIVGIRCDSGWEDALRGRVRQEFVADALNLPRLYVLERKQATLTNLRAAIRAARLEHPGEPVMFAIDYAQLIRGDAREIRQRVSDTFERIDDLAREEHAVAIVVSQMGRAGAKAAREGDRLGADAADLGAESAAIERFATITLTIGKAGEPREDGSRAVEISVGKARMGEGDRVVPASYWGKSGLWRVAGESKSADAVRTERDAQAEEKQRTSAEMAMIGTAQKAPAPLSKNQLIDAITGRKQTKLAAVSALIARGDLVETTRFAPRTKKPLIWTPEHAAKAGILPRPEDDK